MQSNKGRSRLSMDGYSSEWRGRPVSPQDSVSRKAEAFSSGAAAAHNNNSKYNRRPLPPSGGKSVAALQHQWLAAQQQEQQSMMHGSIRSNSSSGGSYRSVSPLPIRSRLAFEPGNDESEEEEEPQNDEEGQDDDEEDDDDDGGDAGEEENNGNYEYTTAPVADDLQSDQSSFMSSPSIITASSNQFSSSQEFKVAREGWLYKKNNLMQWRPVYAVAKHGNAIKPGALYLYKDDKFANHIHTYDMSEVVEVEPKKQDYRPGIKWELRLLVKRDDVVLATDDLTTRKDWINSLTSIMGKVSLATHTELQSRTISMEQLNRQLQATTAALEHENNQLRQELAEAQKRVRSQASEHAARESGLTSELEHVRLEMEQQVAAKTDDLEQQKMTWQAKAQEWQAQAHDWRDQVAGLSEERDGLLDERDRWMDERADLMDERNRWMDDQQQWMMMNTSPHHHHSNSRRRQQPSMNGDDSDVRDVKYQLQSLRDQLKDPLLQTRVLDIKSGVSKLMDTFDDARRGWSDLQTDLVKLLQVEEKDRDRLLDAFQTEFMAMRDSSHSSYGKLESLLAELQASHTQLVDSMTKNDDTKALDEALERWQQEQRQWMDDMQTKILAQLSAGGGGGGGGNNKKSASLEPTQDPQAHQKFLLSVLERHINGLKDGQDRGREEDDKSFKVLGQLFQHVIQQLDEMVVPDITPSLDELADRLMTLDERLQRIQLYRDGDGSSSSLPGDARTLDDEDVRELVIGTRGFMERTLRVLDRFGGSQSGLEETVRRAVKNAFNSQFMDIKDPHGNEERLKRYEENARGYIDKAMSGMRGHLEDYTGVMYKMIEDLILRAVQHLDTNNSNIDTTTTMTTEQHDRLKTEINRLKKERDELERQVKDLGLENNQAAVDLAKKKTELQACTAEYERVQRQIQQARQDSLAAVARDLEPLVRQINLLKQATPESFYSDDSEHSGGFVDLGPSRSNHRADPEEKQYQRRSYTSSRPSTTPLSAYLNRK